MNCPCSSHSQIVSSGRSSVRCTIGVDGPTRSAAGALQESTTTVLRTQDGRARSRISSTMTGLVARMHSRQPATIRATIVDPAAEMRVRVCWPVEVGGFCSQPAQCVRDGE